MKNNTKKRLLNIVEASKQDEIDDDADSINQDTTIGSELPSIPLNNHVLMLRKRYSNITIEVLASSKSSKETSKLFNLALSHNKTLQANPKQKSKVGYIQ